jgi:hypothetical protein
MTCASVYYYGRVDVKCATELGEAVWGYIAEGVRKCLGNDCRSCLEASLVEQQKRVWFLILLAERVKVK